MEEGERKIILTEKARGEGEAIGWREQDSYHK